MSHESNLKCIQIIFFILNLILLLVGCILVGVTVWLAFFAPGFVVLVMELDDKDQVWVTAAYWILACGIAVLIVAIVGFIGAATRKKNWLKVYIIFAVMALIFQIVGFTLGFVFRTKLWVSSQNIGNSLQDEIHNETYGFYDPVSQKLAYTDFGEALNFIQMELDCCGVESETDYVAAKMQPLFSQDYPYACCSNAAGDSKATHLPSGETCTVYKDTDGVTIGCLDIIYSDRNIMIIFGMAVGVAAVELICLILVSCLFHQVRRLINV